MAFSLAINSKKLIGSVNLNASASFFQKNLCSELEIVHNIRPYNTFQGPLSLNGRGPRGLSAHKEAIWVPRLQEALRGFVQINRRLESESEREQTNEDEDEVKDIVQSKGLGDGACARRC